MRRNSCIPILGVLAACGPKESPQPAVDSTAVTPAPVAATMPPPTSPVGSWRWVSIVTPVETIQAPATGQYTLVIGDSTATGVADCNRMTGKATWTERTHLRADWPRRAWPARPEGSVIAMASSSAPQRGGSTGMTRCSWT